MKNGLFVVMACSVAAFATGCGSTIEDDLTDIDVPSNVKASTSTFCERTQTWGEEGKCEEPPSSPPPPSPPAPPPPSACAVSVEPKDVYCSGKPLGNPRAECGAFGLKPAGKDDGLSGTSFTASQDAYVAIVKSGNHGCGSGNAAYRVYVGVKTGDTLLTPVDQGISHVTYCACP